MFFLDAVVGPVHPHMLFSLWSALLLTSVCVCVFHSGGSFHIRGYEPILSLLLFVSALALHSRQLDLKLRLDFLWAVQVWKFALLCLFKHEKAVDVEMPDSYMC